MRLNELDALRGIAAFAVFLFHFKFFIYGSFGVYLFFIVSGFVIFLTAQKVESPYKFVIARISRLYPTYWFAITIITCCFLLTGTSVTASKFFINMTMLEGFLGGGGIHKYIARVSWTLTEEIIFYTTIFFLLLFKILNKSSIWGGLMLCFPLIGLVLAQNGLLTLQTSYMSHTR